MRLNRKFEKALSEIFPDLQERLEYTAFGGIRHGIRIVHTREGEKRSWFWPPEDNGNKKLEDTISIQGIRNRIK